MSPVRLTARTIVVTGRGVTKEPLQEKVDVTERHDERCLPQVLSPDGYSLPTVCTWAKDISLAFNPRRRFQIGWRIAVNAISAAQFTTRDMRKQPPANFSVGAVVAGSHLKMGFTRQLG